MSEETEREEKKAVDCLKAELIQAYSAPETSYTPLTAAEVIRRYKHDDDPARVDTSRGPRTR